MPIKLPLFCLLAGLTGLSAASGNEVSPLTKTVDTLGRINGRALACSYPDIVSRTKSIVISRVPKARELGETFEVATQSAFLEQGKAPDECPPHKTLSHQLDTAARGLAAPSPNQLVNNSDLPAAGLPVMIKMGK